MLTIVLSCPPLLISHLVPSSKVEGYSLWEQFHNGGPVEPIVGKTGATDIGPANADLDKDRPVSGTFALICSSLLHLRWFKSKLPLSETGLTQSLNPPSSSHSVTCRISTLLQIPIMGQSQTQCGRSLFHITGYRMVDGLDNRTRQSCQSPLRWLESM